MSSAGRSFAERAGVAGDERELAVTAVLAAAAQAELRTVRVSFADQHGLLRTKTVPTDRLTEVMHQGLGIPGSLLAKDTADTYAVPLWTPSGLPTLDGLVGAQDMVMLADPAMFRVLPWLDATGWLLCDLYTTGAEPIALSTRRLCQQAAHALADAGYHLQAGLEIELHLYDAADGRPIHPGWELLGENHADLVHDRIEPLCAGLDALGLPPRSMEVELGPGQIELTFPQAEAGAMADAAVLVRSAVSQLARRHGMRASFMCRPAIEESFPSGWHLHQSLTDSGGGNCFVPEPARDGANSLLSETGRHWVGGLLTHAAQSCLLSTPTVNGYKRYRPNSVAPDRVAWSRQHRGAMLRVIGGPGDPATRVENRAGDPAANPYLYVASQLVAGLDGLCNRREPPAAAIAPYHPDAGPRLPRSLGEAIEAFEQATVYRKAWGNEVVDYLATLKRSEWSRFLSSVTDWEQREYFELF